MIARLAMRLEHCESGGAESAARHQAVHERKRASVDGAAGGAAHEHADHPRFQQASVAVSRDEAEQGERQAPYPEHTPWVTQQIAHQEERERVPPGQCAVEVEHRDRAALFDSSGMHHARKYIVINTISFRMED